MRRRLWAGWLLGKERRRIFRLSTVMFLGSVVAAVAFSVRLFVLGQASTRADIFALSVDRSVL